MQDSAAFQQQQVISQQRSILPTALLSKPNSQQLFNLALQLVEQLKGLKEAIARC